MAKIEVYFQNGRLAKFDPEKVAFTTAGYRQMDGFGEATDFARMLSAGGALVNWPAVSFIRLVPERDEEDE